MKEKRLFQIGVFLLLLIAVPLTLYLVRHQQILRSRATGEGSSIEFLGVTGGITHVPNVNLKLTYGTGSAPSPSPSPTPTPRPTATPPPGSVPCTGGAINCTQCVNSGGGTCGGTGSKICYTNTGSANCYSVGVPTSCTLPACAAAPTATPRPTPTPTTAPTCNKSLGSACSSDSECACIGRAVHCKPNAYAAGVKTCQY